MARTYEAWTPTRNGNYKLENPRPKPVYDDACCTGDVGADGFEVMSKADPSYTGQPPSVRGTAYPMRRGPDSSFEQ